MSAGQGRECDTRDGVGQKVSHSRPMPWLCGAISCQGTPSIDSMGWEITGVVWSRRDICSDEGRKTTSLSVPALLASPRRSGDPSLAKDVRPAPHRSVPPQL